MVTAIGLGPLSWRCKWEFTPDTANTSTPKLKAIDQLNLQPRAAVTRLEVVSGGFSLHPITIN